METNSRRDFLIKYTQMIEMKKYSNQTLKSYKYHLIRFLDFKNKVSVKNLSSRDINDYLVCLVDSDVSDSYFNQAINAIRFFFKYVLNKKIKDYLVVRPKKAITRPIILDKQEVQAMFDNCKNLKHLAILSLLYSSALRVSEVVNLKISDIDSKQMIIRIRSAKGRKDRLVNLNQKCLDVLRQYYLKYKPKEYLFNGQFSNKYTAHSIQLWIKKLAYDSGINKDVYPHLIRHTALTHNLEQGVDIRLLQVVAGHANIKTTLGYTHISPQFISSIPSPMLGINIMQGRIGNKVINKYA